MTTIREKWKAAPKWKKALIIIGGAVAVAGLVAFAAPLIAPLGSKLAGTAGMKSVLGFSKAFSGKTASLAKFLTNNTDKIVGLSKIATEAKTAKAEAKLSLSEDFRAENDNDSRVKTDTYETKDNKFKNNKETFDQWAALQRSNIKDMRDV